MKVLIVIDMQKDFIDGALGTKEAQAILPAVVNRIEKSENELILFTFDTHQEDYLVTTEGKKLPVIHCVENSEGWQFDAGILNAWYQNNTTIKLENTNSHMFYKPVFGSVELVQYLSKHASEISEIELIGVCTDICVISNALMIKNTLPDIKISVNSNLCAGVTPDTHDAALKVMTMCHIDVI